MPMVIDFFTHLFSLDLAWFVWLIFANLFFLFTFIALIHYLYPKTKHLTQIVLFVLFCINIWAVVDFSLAVGWIITGSVFLMIHYITRVALVTLVESPKTSTRTLVILMMIQFYAVYIFYNLFMR